MQGSGMKPWTPVCPSAEIVQWATRHVKATLRFWEEGRTDRANAPDVPTRYAALLSNVGKFNLQKLVLVQLIDGVMHLHTASWCDSFTANVVSWLHAALRQMTRLGWKADGMSFIISSHASMDSYPNGTSRAFPIMTACMRTHGAQPDHGILMPRTYKIYAADKPLSSLGRYNNWTWEQKQPVAVFRGALSAYGRVRLLQHANRSKLTNIACTLLPKGAESASVRGKWHAGGPELWMSQHHLPACSRANKINMEAQQQYRYLIVPNGVGCADRLKQLLSSSSVVLLQDSELCEFWQHDLKPYRNYVPVDRDFANLESQIEWAEARPAQMKAIIQRNQLYASKFLTSRPQLCYLAILLARYAALFDPGSTPYAGSQTYAAAMSKWQGTHANQTKKPPREAPKRSRAGSQKSSSAFQRVREQLARWG